MDHAQPRNRKPATYGSKNKTTPKTRIKGQKEGKAIAKGPQNSQDSTSSTRQSKSKARDSVGSKDSGRSIYDLPSSEDEAQHRILRRKKRRHGSNGEDANAYPDLARPAKVAAGRSDYSSRRGASATPRPSSGSQQRKEEHREAPQISGKKQKISNSKTAQVLAHHAMDTSAREERPSDEEVTTRHSVKANGLSQSQRPTTPTRVLAEHVPVINTTPGRRRLIDSLGTRDDSGENSPTTSVTPAESQPPSPIRPHTPHRPPPAILRDKAEETGPTASMAVSPHLQSSKVTYARQRSFLDDMVSETKISLANATLGLEPSNQAVERLQSPREPPHARIIAVEDLDLDSGSVRSIHELRQAGGNTRFQGAIDSIFEDIEDTHVSTAGRCSALVQLCDKLLEPKLARQFVECGFDKKLVDCLSKDFDLISTTLALCVFSLSSFVRPVPYIIAKCAWPKLLDISGSLLNAPDSIISLAQAPEHRLPKAIQTSVREATSRAASVLFPDMPKSYISPRLVALRCLKPTFAKVQENSEPSQNFPQSISRQIMNFLLTECSALKETNASLTPGKSQTLLLGLSILEMHTTSHALHKDYDFLGSLPELQGILQIQENALDSASQHIQILYIRVILNVTNSNPLLCDAFAKPVIVTELARIAIVNFKDLAKESLGEETSALDRVILALGALINLTEQSETSRVAFLKRTRAHESLLAQMLHLFLTHVDSTSEVRLRTKTRIITSR